MVIVSIPIVLFAILDAVWMTAGIVMILYGISDIQEARKVARMEAVNAP